MEHLGYFIHWKR